MKVVHVTPVYAPAWQYGGPVRSTHLLACALAAKGHEITVLTTTIGTPQAGALDVLSHTLDGVHVLYCPGRVTGLGIVSPRLTATAESLAAGAHAFHLTGVWQPSIIGVQRLLAKRKTPYVVSTRGALSPYSFQQSRWKKLPYYYLFEQKILRGAAALHATAPIECEELNRLRLGVPIFTAPNICDALPWFDDAAGRKAWRQSYAIAPDECVIMHVGRIHPKKNLHFLVESAAALSSQRAWRVVLVGPVAERDEPYLSQLQANLPPQRLTVIRGTGDGDALRAAYSSADVFVLPSFAENFGNAVVEALLCNTPVVLSPHVGVGSLVEPLGGTTILPLSQARWVAELEQRLKLSPEQRVDARARLQIAELFSAESIAAQFEQLYASCTTAHHTAAIG